MRQLFVLPAQPIVQRTEDCTEHCPGMTPPPVDTEFGSLLQPYNSIRKQLSLSEPCSLISTTSLSNALPGNNFAFFNTWPHTVICLTTSDAWIWLFHPILIC
jgi:hypothetical protein